MKRLVLSVAVLAFLSVSCGPSMCDCVALDEKRSEAEDKDKFKEDNKSTYEACEKMIEEKEKEIEAIEDEEKKKEAVDKWLEEMGACE